MVQGSRFRPYGAEALRFYREQLGRPVSVRQAQKAQMALRQPTPARVSKSARSAYAVEDAALQRWFQNPSAVGRWPPTSPQGDMALEDG